MEVPGVELLRVSGNPRPGLVPPKILGIGPTDGETKEQKR